LSWCLAIGPQSNKGQSGATICQENRVAGKSNRRKSLCATSIDAGDRVFDPRQFRSCLWAGRKTVPEPAQCVRAGRAGRSISASVNLVARPEPVSDQKLVIVKGNDFPASVPALVAWTRSLTVPNW